MARSHIRIIFADAKPGGLSPKTAPINDLQLAGENMAQTLPASPGQGHIIPRVRVHYNPAEELSQLAQDIVMYRLRGSQRSIV